MCDVMSSDVVDAPEGFRARLNVQVSAKRDTVSQRQGSQLSWSADFRLQYEE